MSDFPGSASQAVAAPIHPLDERYYVYSARGATGPFTGHTIRQMIANGEITPTTQIAKVGESQWLNAANLPVFNGFLTGGARPAGAPGQVEYAGFWIRLGAYLLDAIILTLGSYAAGFLFGIILAIITLGKIDSSVASGLGGLLGLGLAIAYNIIFVSGNWQATPGKRIVGIHVIREDGGRLSGLHAFGRYLSYILSSLILCIGFMMIGWTDQKKGLHDIVAGTRVVYGKL